MILPIPNQATVVAQKFASDKEILFILGHNNSGCSMSALPSTRRPGCRWSPPPTPTDDHFAGAQNYMRVIVDDNAIVGQQVLLAVKELGFKKPVVIWENTDYGKGMRDVAYKTLRR